MTAIDKFREYLKEHTDKYVIIGGTACEQIFRKREQAFRATKDIDMVLCVDNVDAAFAGALKAFLDAGGYQAQRRGEEDRRNFYRFEDPTEPGFPDQIELFARNIDAQILPEGTLYTRIDVDEDIVSLSGILLNDDYFALLMDGRKEIDSVTVLDEQRLIPFKAFAHVQHVEAKSQGANRTKHRNDVFRLLTLMDPAAKVDVPDPIKSDIRKFIEIVGADAAFSPRQFGAAISPADGFQMLGDIYGL